MSRRRRCDVCSVHGPISQRTTITSRWQPAEGKTAKNRVHLDLNVSAGAPDKEEAWRRVLAHQDKLLAAGATILYESNDPTGRCMVMQDPEGNEFCIQ